MRGQSLFVEKRCENCNKLIYPTESWTYKIQEFNEPTKWYCSWSCFRKGQKEYEQSKKIKRRSFKWRYGQK